MSGDFPDDWDYLERQVEQTKGGGAAQDERRGKEREDKSHDRKSRDRDRRSRSRERRGADIDRDRRDDRRGDRGARTGERDRDNRVPNDRGRPQNEARGPKRRERTPPEVRALREQEKELKDVERSLRTCMAMNINLRAEELDIFRFFSQAGKVVDVKLITDKNTKKSKGFAYIEYSRQDEVMAAVSLNGQILLGQPIMVKSAEHEKNLAWEAQEQAKQNQKAATTLLGSEGVVGVGSGAGPCRLYVGNLLPKIGDAELQALFEPFGQLEYAQIVRDAGGNSQAYGYVQFASTPQGVAAVQYWNGREVAGTKLQISVAPPPCAATLGVQPGVAGVPGAGVPGMAGALPGPPGMPMPGVGDANRDSSITELDDEEEKGGLKLSSNARQALMSRLASSAGLQAAPSFMFPGAQAPGAGAAGPGAPKIVDPGLTLDQGRLGPSSPVATACLLLKNMFSPEEESGDNWDAEIAEDVKSECSKYGPLVHCFVDPASKGHVYLKFVSPDGAMAAQRALHGRYFASRQIAAEFQFAHAYAQAFGA